MLVCAPACINPRLVPPRAVRAADDVAPRRFRRHDIGHALHVQLVDRAAKQLLHGRIAGQELQIVVEDDDAVDRRFEDGLKMCEGVGARLLLVMRRGCFEVLHHRAWLAGCRGHHDPKPASRAVDCDKTFVLESGIPLRQHIGQPLLQSHRIVVAGSTTDASTSTYRLPIPPLGSETNCAVAERSHAAFRAQSAPRCRPPAP
jgi:hypothetical protein